MKLVFGAMCPSIENQLTEQGVKFKSRTIDNFQRCSEAIIRLRIQGILNLSDCKKAEQRLFNKISKYLNEMEN